MAALAETQCSAPKTSKKARTPSSAAVKAKIAMAAKASKKKAAHNDGHRCKNHRLRKSTVTGTGSCFHQPVVAGRFHWW
jgi:hypothetical protein